MHGIMPKTPFFLFIESFHMPSTPNQHRKILTVAALAHPRMLATSITLPVEILRAAAQASRERPTPNVVLHLMSNSPGLLPLADGLTLTTQAIQPDLKPDVLLVPAIWRTPHWVLNHCRWQIDIIDTAIRQGSYVCSVGTGSYLVAETGHLSGSQATTHWHWFDDFAKTYPMVKLRRDQLITQSERIFCVGSVNSIADLMVYLAGKIFSPRCAQAIENQFSPEIRRRFAPHELGMVGSAHNDEKILDAQLYLRNRLQQAVSLSELASAIELTPRTLTRRFKRAVGRSPNEYLQYLRMEEARTLLNHSNLSITEVAWSVGVNDASRFTQSFKRDVGMTPRQYRQAVRGKSFTLT